MAHCLSALQRVMTEAAAARGSRPASRRAVEPRVARPWAITLELSDAGKAQDDALAGEEQRGREESEQHGEDTQSRCRVGVGAAAGRDQRAAAEGQSSQPG